jgi:hypothetical protein
MTSQLTPIEREIAAILEADIRVRLDARPVTAAALKAALIESVQTLSPPIALPEIIAERDPDDRTRINFLVPADWFATFMTPIPTTPRRASRISSTSRAFRC